MEHSADLPAAESGAEDAASALRAEVEELQAKLRLYERLEDDLMAQRVFVKARRQLTTWITVGGLVAFSAGFVGFRQLESYVHDQAKQRVDRITDVEVKREMHAAINDRVDPVAAQLTIIESRWQQQLSDLSGRLPINSVVAVNATATPAVVRAATRVDRRSQMLPVRNEGAAGSSVGFAVAAALEYQLAVHAHRRVSISPLFIYYYARKQGGFSVHADTGANIKDAITVLAKQGAVADDAWPYAASQVTHDPPASVRKATHYRIARRIPLDGVDEIKAALERYGPVVIGLTVYDSLVRPATARTGDVPDPKPSEKIVGGHAVCLVGYDDATRRFTFRNSWGPSWGKGGYGTLSYRYVQKYGSDAWAITV